MIEGPQSVSPLVSLENLPRRGPTNSYEPSHRSRSLPSPTDRVYSHIVTRSSASSMTTHAPTTAVTTVGGSAVAVAVAVVVPATAAEGGGKRDVDTTIARLFD